MMHKVLDNVGSIISEDTGLEFSNLITLLECLLSTRHAFSLDFKKLWLFSMQYVILNLTYNLWIWYCCPHFLRLGNRGSERICYLVQGHRTVSDRLGFSSSKTLN